MDNEKKSTEKVQDEDNAKDSNPLTDISDFWQDKNHKDLLFYLVVGIVMLELVVGVAAFFYSIVNATPGGNGLPPRFQFPWIAYGIAAVVAPAILLLIVHLLGIGLFRSLKRSPEEEAKWKQKLPVRVQRVYAIVQGAPTALLLIGIVALGLALFYIDGAMQALLRLGSVLEGYLLYIIAAIVIVWCIAYSGRMWYNYRVKKLESEYQFRRDIFESSGIVIVDKNCIQLPPSAMEINSARMLDAGQETLIEIGEDNLVQNEDKKDNPEQIIDVIEVDSDDKEIQEPGAKDVHDQDTDKPDFHNFDVKPPHN